MPSLNDLINMFPTNKTLLKYKDQVNEYENFYLCGQIKFNMNDNIHLNDFCENEKLLYDNSKNSLDMDIHEEEYIEI